MGDDFDQLLERLPKWADWLFSTPWPVPAVLAALLTAFLVWLSWPRAQGAPAIPDGGNIGQHPAPEPLPVLGPGESERPALKLADARSRELAGIVAAMKERAQQRPFKFPLDDVDPFVAQYEDLKNSTHPIWADRDINQLRRDFLHSCHLIGTETEIQMTGAEARELRQDLVRHAENLAAALLGRPYQTDSNEHSTFAPALNVSGVLVQVSELRSHQRLHITFTVFNGNAHDVFLTSIYGHVQFNTEDGRGTKLYSPTLTNVRSNKIPAHDTVRFTAQVQVPKKLAEVVPDWPEDTSFALEFTELDIHIRSGERPPHEARLPLWDAAVVRRQGDQFTTARRHYIR